jgi:hypothetical protein
MYDFIKAPLKLFQQSFDLEKWYHFFSFDSIPNRHFSILFIILIFEIGDEDSKVIAG